MTKTSIYDSIAERTSGDIYIGIVGPVRTGKSTFIKNFMQTIVLPDMEDISKKERATDELPQSASGRTIMTTEPKFIPEEAVQLKLGSSMECRVRMIDCVGYVVPSSLGYIENSQPRMVKTPWFDEEIPFNMAAEVGTKKVITEHSTVGIVVTTDGSIGEIPREEYEKAEERVVQELKELEKPFMVILNCKEPEGKSAKELSESLSEKYKVSVVPVNCLEMTGDEIEDIITQLLYEFPIKEMVLNFPGWISALEKEHELKKDIFSSITSAAADIKKVRDTDGFFERVRQNEKINFCQIENVDLSKGSVKAEIRVNPELYYKILSEKTGFRIDGEKELMKILVDLSAKQEEYERFRTALEEVEATGYGIVMPTMSELTLEDPEIMKQGGKYGVRLKASAPSIHMLKANINTEVAPLVGTESQSEELIMYLLKEFEENPAKIWESNIFGKTLNSLVNEGLHNKLCRMPAEARMKLQETLERVINEGCSGLICIII